MIAARLFREEFLRAEKSTSKLTVHYQAGSNFPRHVQAVVINQMILRMFAITGNRCGHIWVESIYTVYKTESSLRPQRQSYAIAERNVIISTGSSSYPLRIRK